MANITHKTSHYPRVLTLASGAGSTFVAFARAVSAGRLHAQLVGLISDRQAPALERAAELKVEATLVEYRKGDEVWPTRLAAVIRSFRPDYIVLAGFLRKIPAEIVREFKGQIYNSHPALLPKHGGPGMYGAKVHKAVIAAGDTETGVTLHHVTENYDEGGAVAQLKIAVGKNDPAATLEQRLKDLEKEFLITELQKIFSHHPKKRS